MYPLVARAVTLQDPSHYPHPSETYGYALEARGILTNEKDTSSLDLSQYLAATSYESMAVSVRMGVEAPSEAQNSPTRRVLPQNEEDMLSVKRMVEEEFGAGHVMVEIARAESQFVETAANPKSTARGVFQILVGTFNDPYYGCTGDRHKAKDNIECARKIYEKSGTVPWASSQASWGYN